LTIGEINRQDSHIWLQ